ncbi:MAG: beta-ketoacyl-[acyl-carrier-protein] synthase family protein [Phycisphaerae bacterium]
MRRVVVTGVGVVSPVGLGKEAFWQNLLAGQCGLRTIDLFDPGGFGCHLGGQVPDYKINDFVPKTYRKATKVMARDIELAVIAADDAMKDAGLATKAYGESGITPERFGCNIGAGLISAELNELTAAMHHARSGNDLDLKAWGSEGINHLTPLWLLKYLPNMLACHVTIIHGLMGPSNTITCADASGHLAVGEAYRTIQRNDADVAVCGGAETKLNPMGMMRQNLLGRLNPDDNDAPERAVRPFADDATGTVLGEGGGLLVLEEYEHARARGARVYCEIVGFGASQDVYSVTEPDPTGRSYAAAVTRALMEAHVKPADVGGVVAHGLGIKAHDAAELAGLTTSFGEHLARIPVSLLKPQVGSLAAGDSISAAAAVLALHEGQMPPARNAGNGTLNTSNDTRPTNAETMLTTVYSLGGQNAALLFRRV